MQNVRSRALPGALALLLPLCAACTPDGGDGAGGTGGAPAVTSHAYRGTYEVPVSPELASAAVFDVPKVEWTITAGSVKLEYDLPLGLVGKPLRVEFTGPIAAAATTASLTGAPGTANCDVAAAAVSCLETMTGLLPVNPDYAVIEQIAQTEYSGPASQRLDVAEQFAVDPIGIVHIDLTAPVDDDSHEVEKVE